MFLILFHQSSFSFVLHLTYSKKSATNNIYRFIFTAPEREVSSMRKYVKKDILKGIFLLCFLFLLFLALLASQLNCINGTITEVNSPVYIVVTDSSNNPYRLRPFLSFYEKYKVGDSVRIYYYPHSDDAYGEKKPLRSIIIH